jgi:hypothetical protein
VQPGSKPRQFLLWLVSPVVVAFFSIGAMYKAGLGWWLDPILQRRRNGGLREEIRSTFHFLFPDGQFVTERATKPLPFDLVSVAVRWNNLMIYFARGRGSESVSVGPIHFRESHELGLLIAALGERHYSEQDLISTFSDAASLLRPRLAELNLALSAERLEEFRKRL